jgi:hypothetical protein
MVTAADIQYDLLLQHCIYSYMFKVSLEKLLSEHGNYMAILNMKYIYYRQILVS